MIFGKGTSFSWNGAVVAKLLNVGHPDISVDSVDVTTHDSATRFREFVAGLADAGEVAISGYFEASDTTGQVAMYTDAAAGTVREVIITGPNSEYTFTFNAFITKIKPIGDAPIDGELAFEASVKISGQPVLAIATSAGLTTAFFTVSNSAVVIPTPANAVYLYNASVLTGVSSITVTPTATAGVITVNGNVVATGQASSAITLGAAGSVTPVTIIVTETNKQPKKYVINVARA